VSKVFSSTRVPSWETLALIIEYLGGDLENFKRLWYEATGGEPEGGKGLVNWATEARNDLRKGVDKDLTSLLRTRPWPGPQPRIDIRTVASPSELAEQGVSNILKQSATGVPVEKLSAALDDTEDLILDCCKEILLPSLGKETGMQVPRFLKNAICTDAGIFAIRIRPGIQSDRTLHLILQPIQPVQNNTDESYFEAKISVDNSIGRYNFVKIKVPACFGIDFFEEVKRQVLDVFSAGYSWLSEFARQVFISLSTPFGREALRRFRRQFFSRDHGAATKQIWMTMVRNQGVSHVVDDEVVCRTLEGAGAFSRLQWPPASVGLAFLADSIPFGKSFARQALGAQRAIDVNLAQAPYRDVSQDFLIGQSILYTDGMRVTPLAINRQVSLLAVYPSRIESEIDEILHVAGADLTEYLSSNRV
jgi:hypothetical protein